MSLPLNTLHMQKDLLERYTTILSYKKKDIKGVFKKLKIFNY